MARRAKPRRPVPVWRDVLASGGMVRGTRDNVRALMRDRQTVLVFPGGTREVMKRRGERYKLVLDRIAEDPHARWREAITAFHDTFRDHRAVTIAGAAALPTSPEVAPCGPT